MAAKPRSRRALRASPARPSTPRPSFIPMPNAPSWFSWLRRVPFFGSRLNHENQLGALGIGINDGRGVLGLAGDARNARRDRGLAAITGQHHSLPYRDFCKLAFGNEKTSLDVFGRQQSHDRLPGRHQLAQTEKYVGHQRIAGRGLLLLLLSPLALP